MVSSILATSLRRPAVTPCRHVADNRWISTDDQPSLPL
jgi:hypothetical protein